MNTPEFCPQCGEKIPPDSPQGVCPRCVLRAGLKLGEETLPVTEDSEQREQAGRFIPPKPHELEPYFPQLEILDVIGHGGMGAVYKARQRGLDRLVALKILPPSIGRDPSFAERFTREARALARLNHPNIVGVYDSGKAGDYFFLLMEYVDGVNLREAIQSHSLSPREALAVVPQICEALQFAHDEGIVHRDIKPENVLLDKRGRVKVADFGLAKLLGQSPDDYTLTHTHQVMGTPRYMAPEQMEGARAVDHRADIYSLGVVFYELLTGELPLGRFDPPSKKVRVDVRLDEVVLRTLAKEPDRRYQHASEVKTDVESISGGTANFAMQAGYEWRSKAELFGIPLIHVAKGFDPQTGRKRIARGIIAIGDIAIGVFALGGVACGGFTFGGLSMGLVSLGGFSLGLLLALGGAAIGLGFSAGGLAVGSVAVGGCGVGYYAYGGAAFGRYVYWSGGRDVEAVELVTEGIPSAAVQLISDPALSALLAVICGLGLLCSLVWVWRKDASRDDSDLIDKQGKPQIVRRSTVVPVLGVLNLIVGFLGLVLVSADLLMPADPNNLVEQAAANSRFYQIWSPVSMLIDYISSAALMVGGVGLLMWMAWARRLTLWAAVLMFVKFIIELPFVMAYTIIPILTDASQPDPEFPPEVALPTAITLIVGLFVFGLTYNVMLLILLTRPRVVASCDGERQTRERAIERTETGKPDRSGVWVAVLAIGLLACCPCTCMIALPLSYSFVALEPAQVSQEPGPTAIVSGSRAIPVQPIDSRDWHSINGGIELSTGKARAWNLTPDQHREVNAAMTTAHLAYLNWEADARKTRTEDGRQITTIPEPPESERRRWENEFWTELDGTLDVEQQRLARLNLDLYPPKLRGGLSLAEIVRPGILGWGDSDARVEIGRVGAWFEWNVAARKFDHSDRGPSLPSDYERFWKEPTDAVESSSQP